jgi:hypothetical protein
MMASNRAPCTTCVCMAGVPLSDPWSVFGCYAWLCACYLQLLLSGERYSLQLVLLACIPCTETPDCVLPQTSVEQC